MDQLAALRLFVHIARSESISSAGRALGLSATIASKRLQDLETVLGVRLVDRTTRQLALTEAGERLLARSADMLDEIQSALAGAKGHAKWYLANGPQPPRRPSRSRRSSTYIAKVAVPEVRSRPKWSHRGNSDRGCSGFDDRTLSASKGPKRLLTRNCLEVPVVIPRLL